MTRLMFCLRILPAVMLCGAGLLVVFMPKAPPGIQPESKVMLGAVIALYGAYRVVITIHRKRFHGRSRDKDATASD